MQKIISVKTPTPQNISKWSISRKGIIKNNKFLTNQLNSKNLIISELEKENNELRIKVKLMGLDFPEDISDSKEYDFKYTLIYDDGKNLTYTVTNDTLSIDTAINIPIRDIIEYFNDSSISQRELDSFIKDYINDSI